MPDLATSVLSSTQKIDSREFLLMEILVGAIPLAHNDEIPRIVKIFAIVSLKEVGGSKQQSQQSRCQSGQIKPTLCAESSNNGQFAHNCFGA